MIPSTAVHCCLEYDGRLLQVTANAAYMRLQNLHYGVQHVLTSCMQYIMHGTALHCILTRRWALAFQEDESQLLIVIPPNTPSLLNPHAIRAIQLGPAAAVCPGNRCPTSLHPFSCSSNPVLFNPDPDPNRYPYPNPVLSKPVSSNPVLYWVSQYQLAVLDSCLAQVACVSRS